MMNLDKTSWNASDDEWNDWRWQLSQSWHTEDKVLQALELQRPEVFDRYPMQATPFYLSLAQTPSIHDPVLRQCVPSPEEFLPSPTGRLDPFGEEAYSPVPRLVHRYRDRALFMTTSACAVHCRHCMRKRNWQCFEGRPDNNVLAAARDYVERHEEIREILISGGDPMTLGDAPLAEVLHAFASINHVEMLRVGSRLPVVLPQRFTDSCCEILETCGKPVWLATHFNHPQELSPEAAQAVERLLRHGVPVINQSVLLKGINDDAETLRRLFTGLLKIKIKPYYLFHGDPIEGTLHFRTGVEAGLKLMEQLRNHVSGLAIPTFSFDLPDSGGKIRLEPDSKLQKDADGNLLFNSFEGRTIRYKV